MTAQCFDHKGLCQVQNCFVLDEDLQVSCEFGGCGYVPDCRSLGSAHSGQNWTPSAGEPALGHTALGHPETLGTVRSLCVCVVLCVCVCVCAQDEVSR